MGISMRRAGHALGTCWLLVGLAGPVQAGYTLFTSQSSFNAATTGVTTIGFEGIAAAGGFTSYTSTALTVSGVSFSTPDGTLFVIGNGYYNNIYQGGSFITSDYSTTGTDVLNITLPGPRSAFSLNFGGLLGSPATFTFNLSDGQSFSATSQTNATGNASLDFLGVTTTDTFSSISISMPDFSNYNAIDNFGFGLRGGVVPEPSSFLLTIAGMSSIGWLSRRRRPSAA